ncbi:hypothetical protein Acr_03g0016650 [Actinidia rufa]|uniref:Uncharacterized protein n=1 Tax=Actinidia rufa TaxID=165716 RepID=A0A7J0EEI6_9ERIC|nr:hypothetical protein Acr_03g0016650 [Actinidia rufa]
MKDTMNLKHFEGKLRNLPCDLNAKKIEFDLPEFHGCLQPEEFLNYLSAFEKFFDYKVTTQRVKLLPQGSVAMLRHGARRDKLGVDPKDAQKRQVEALVVFCEEDKDEGLVDVLYQTIYDEGSEVSREDIELEEGESLMIQRVLTSPRVEKESECTTNL